MNTIIEKIRAEVNKLPEEYKGLYKQFGNSLGFIDGLDMVKKILSDLEKEEKPMNPQPVKIDIRKELASIEFMGVNDARDTETIARHFYALGRQSKPKPMEGFEEEIREFVEQEWDGLHDNDGNPLYTADYLEYIARHFAKWGAEHRGSSEVPKDLEEAAKNYAEDNTWVNEFTNDGEVPEWYKHTAEVFKAGAKWDREQMMKDCVHEVNQAYFRGIDVGKARQEDLMMKDAVEGIVMNFSSNEPKPTVIVDAKGFNQGDRVRVIVCKKED